MQDQFFQDVKLLWRKLMFLPHHSLIQLGTLQMQGFAPKNGRRAIELPPTLTSSGWPVPPSLGIRYHICGVTSHRRATERVVWPLHRCSQAGSNGGKYMEVLGAPVARLPWLEKAVLGQ